MNLKHVLFAGAAALSLASCGGNDTTHNEAPKEAIKLLDPANMDTTVSPGENFFLYANGAWLNNNEIPDEQVRWGSFEQLIQRNQETLRELLETTAAKKDAAKGSPEQKVGDLYRSAMDTVAIEKAGITPLNATLAQIDAIQDVPGLMKQIAALQTQGISVLFGMGIGPDDKNVTQMIAQFYQGGLGLPDRDYYTKADPSMVKLREAYKAYQVNLLKMMGEDDAAATKDAADLFKLETTLANASMTRVAMRDPYKLYNKFDLAGAGKATPGMDWKALFADLKIGKEDSLIIATPGFFKELGKQLTATPLDVWKKYLKFHIVSDMAPYLSSNFDKLHFSFYGTEATGQKAQKPRWKRMLGVVDGAVGELLGKMYVDKHFKPQAKERMMELVNNLQETYADRIKRLDWMSDSTKQKALTKLNTFMKKIGYPDKWRDYSKLEIVGNDFVKNIMATSAWEYEYTIAKLGRPVDKTEWQMTPPTVNAYYNPAFNEIVFPAGILQFPFFDQSADDAVNYGGIGAVIGHEMTHGFDDQGRQYDAEGNLKDWWGPEDAKKFEEKTNVVVKQYDAFTVLDTVHVNGQLTLGENLADLGGLAIAYEAFKKTKQGKSNDKIDGFTPDQRFFLSWAQVWRSKSTDKEAQRRIVVDPHSPGEHRCNGPLSNMPEFYQAFGIKEGDKMWRPENERARVW
ncbi:MAG: M13 family metallopeptidase [Flavipsychrobacter sp.]|nr:M13 family metallopeptidase [Flavipsychrobacter sp.]